MPSSATARVTWSSSTRWFGSWSRLSTSWSCACLTGMFSQAPACGASPANSLRRGRVAFASCPRHLSFSSLKTEKTRRLVWTQPATAFKSTQRWCKTLCADARRWWWWSPTNTSKATPVTFRQSLHSASHLVLIFIPPVQLIINYTIVSTYDFALSLFTVFLPIQVLGINGSFQSSTSPWKRSSPPSSASSPCAITPGLAHNRGSGSG